jgi:hypothetical protein
MVLVFLSRFGLMYLLPAGGGRAQAVTRNLALPSAAIFILLSGTVPGIV